MPLKVLLDIQLTFVLPAIEVRAATPSPTDSVQPVSMSDMLAGSVFERRAARGRRLPEPAAAAAGRRARRRWTAAHQRRPAHAGCAADQQRQPDRSVDRRFRSGSAGTERRVGRSARQSVRRGIRPLLDERHADSHPARARTSGSSSPGISCRGSARAFAGIRAFEPRFSVRGPLKHDRAFLAQDFQFRYVATPVKSLPGEPEIRLKSFDSFTRVDTVMSARHTLGGGLDRVSARDQARDDEHVPAARGDAGLQPERLVDRRRRSVRRSCRTSSSRSTLSGRWFEINVNTAGRTPMVYAPQTQSGSFFNDQEREVRSHQWVEALSLSRKLARPARVQDRHRPATVAVTRASASAGRWKSAGWTDRWPS